MKIYYFTLLIVFFSPILEAQSTLLYNSTGALRIDSIYRIKPEHLKYLLTYESEGVFHQIYENVEYPKKCYENRVGGYVIAKITVNSKESSITCTIERTTDFELKKSVTDAVYKSSLFLLKKTPTEDNVVFYLPFKFEVESEKFDRELEKHRVIKIKKIFLEGRQYLL